ncbi:MAG TPA: dihydrolipoamide acetyltransferase family protein [Solirubrobacteraceae bacterium]|nr:dihydrolipoamide acetyltransferase family protein [Solirubrobacteraceae bacterium]
MTSLPTESATTTLVDVTMPQMGVSVAEGTIVSWAKHIGDHVQTDETICEISTDKIDTEVPAPVSGTVAEILVGVDATVAVGAVLARIAVAGATAPPPAGATPPPSPAAGTRPPTHDLPVSGAPASNGAAGRRYSPVVLRIAAEHGIDLSSVSGTGRGGRVRKQDVLAFIDAAPEAPMHIESPYRPDPAPAAGSGQLSRMRRQIGAHMKRSLETAATCTTWIEVDMTRVQAARVRLGVTALSFVSSAVTTALREHPQLNATLDGERYTQHADINLGIAVSLADDGLIVPVIHRAHELSVEGLASRIRDLATRARARELSPDEVHGGTFTITNPGQYGSIMATPIISQPQVAILDLEAIVKRPVVLTDAGGNDSIAIRAMTILGLSWDHRALDGALSAQFLASVKRVLESV